MLSFSDILCKCFQYHGFGTQGIQCRLGVFDQFGDFSLRPIFPQVRCERAAACIFGSVTGIKEIVGNLEREPEALSVAFEGMDLGLLDPQNPCGDTYSRQKQRSRLVRVNIRSAAPGTLVSRPMQGPRVVLARSPRDR